MLGAALCDQVSQSHRELVAQRRHAFQGTSEISMLFGGIALPEKPGQPLNIAAHVQMHRGFIAVAVAVLALALATQCFPTLQSRWIFVLQSQLIMRLRLFTTISGFKSKAAVSAVPGADMRDVSVSPARKLDAKDRGSFSQQAVQNELDLQVWWHAPFLSGGGYASEAVAFATALDDSGAIPTGALRISQHGDGISVIQVCWVTAEKFVNLV